MAQLEVEGLTRYFGGVAAVSNFSFAVEKGEIRGLIGPNGAGKTTCFNLISGMLEPDEGTVIFEGQRVDHLKANRRARLGLVRTFQRDAIFHKLSVLRNVTVARHLHVREGPLRSIFGHARRIEEQHRQRAGEILDFVGIRHLASEPAGSLPHGHQRALGLAIGLAAEPRLIMLDEPVTGMNPTETEQMTELIRRIRDDLGITVLLVEHNMWTVMGLCERITVLDFGQRLTEGPPSQIQSDERVIEAYLGSEDLVA